jgi:transglutaminase-like putative cysteine protease
MVENVNFHAGQARMAVTSVCGAGSEWVVPATRLQTRKYRCSANAIRPEDDAIHVRPERHGDLVEPEQLTLYPQVPFDTYVDGFGNICTRLIAPAGRLSLWNRFLIADSGIPERLPLYERQHPIGEFPNDVLVFLLGSRYCDTQKLDSLALSLFRGYQEGWARIRAILQYTHDRIHFSYPNARPDRTTWDAHEERIGVCRDFTHLAITLCRCMNIPARYCTGYLGDIGVPMDTNPTDFSAWFEIFLGGAWHALNARHNRARIRRVPMAKGRDAVDAAISTAFGVARLSEFTVFTDEASL